MLFKLTRTLWVIQKYKHRWGDQHAGCVRRSSLLLLFFFFFTLGRLLECVFSINYSLRGRAITLLNCLFIELSGGTRALWPDRLMLRLAVRPSFHIHIYFSVCRGRGEIERGGGSALLIMAFLMSERRVWKPERRFKADRMYILDSSALDCAQAWKKKKQSGKTSESWFLSATLKMRVFSPYGKYILCTVSLSI